MTANTEEKIELSEQTPLKSDTDAPATTDPAAPAAEGDAAAATEKSAKKGFTLFKFGKGNKAAKPEEGAVVAPSEKEKEAEGENKQPKTKKQHWWNKNCNKTCGQAPEGGEAPNAVNLIQRDSHSLQTAIDLTYEEVYGEADSAHSLNAIWKLNHKIFSGVRCFFYKVFSLIVAVPLAILFGILFALTSVLSVFLCIPAGRLFSIPANWIFKVWNFIISGVFDPIFHSIGQCFGNVKISRYGINSDLTTALIA